MVAGAVLGALFLGVIKNALPVIDISPFWQMAISGSVINSGRDDLQCAAGKAARTHHPARQGRKDLRGGCGINEQRRHIPDRLP